jgi:DNA repair ATPase RecN
MQTRNRSAPPVHDLKVWALRGGAAFGTLTLLALSGPLIWAAVSAGAGLAALAGMAAVGFASLQALPLAVQKLENRMLQLRKAEARANPIEQLQNDCLRREERLQSFRQALVTIGGQIENMSQMIQERRHLDPEHVLDRQERALRRMQQFYQANIRRLEEAHAALQAFRHQVKQKMFEWEFAQAGQVVMEALNPSEMQDLMQGLLTDEALGEVQSRFNRVFAELDVELSSMDSPARDYLARNHFDPLDALQVSTVLKNRSTP